MDIRLLIVVPHSTISFGIHAARSSLITRLPRYWQKVVSCGVATCGVPLDKVLAEPGVGARRGATPEATREAAPIFLEREAMFGGAMVRPVRGTWKSVCAAYWRCAACTVKFDKSTSKRSV